MSLRFLSSPTDTSNVQLLATDIAIHAFTPDDGTESAAIKVVHRTAHEEVVNNETPSQRENLRRALAQLVASMNPNPDHIPAPKLILFDRVRVRLPESVHEGEVARISWDFTRGEWKFYVECPNHLVSTWYVLADLDLLEDDAAEGSGDEHASADASGDGSAAGETSE